MSLIITGPLNLGLGDLNDVSLSSPAVSQYLRYDGTSWSNSILNTDVFNYLNTSLTGSGGVVVNKNSGARTIDISLADVTTPGTYGSVSSIPVISVDAKGRITSVSSAAISTTLPDVNPTPGTFGSDTEVPIFTVDTKGRITEVTTVTVSGGTVTSGVTSFNNRAADVVLTADDVISSMCNTNTTKSFIWNATAGNGRVDAGNSSSIYIQRNANYTGGTAGFVNAAVYVASNTPTANSSYEWGIVSEMNSYSNNLGSGGAAAVPQNVAVNGTIRKYGTAPVWGGNFAAVDPATSYSSTSGPLIGIEVNVALSGSDPGLSTIGIDAVPQISNPGQTALAAIAYRASGDSNAKWKYGLDVLTSTVAGVKLQNTGTWGIQSTGTHQVGIDLASATHSTGTALRINTDDFISMSATDQYKFKITSAGVLEFYNNTTRHGYINIANGADVDLASVPSVVAFNTRVGEITLTSSDVTTALGYTPAASADTSFTGTTSVDTLVSHVETISNATGAVNIDLATANVFEITMTGNCTFSFTNAPLANKFKDITIILKQDSVGNRLGSFNNTKWASGSVNILSTAGDAIDVFKFFTYDAGTTYFGNAYILNAV